MKFIIALVVGVAIGYFAGFNDAKANDQNILERTVNSVGGKAKGRNAADAGARDSVTSDPATKH